MWAFQMYGPVWSQLFGKKYYPEIAEKFKENFLPVAENYPYMFSEDGKMFMKVSEGFKRISTDGCPIYNYLMISMTNGKIAATRVCTED